MGGFSGFYGAIKGTRTYAVPGGGVKKDAHYRAWAQNRLDGKRTVLYVDYSALLRIACYSVENSVSKLFIRAGDVVSIHLKIAEAFVRQVEWVGAACISVVLVMEANYSHGKWSTATRVKNSITRISDGMCVCGLLT